MEFEEKIMNEIIRKGLNGPEAEVFEQAAKWAKRTIVYELLALDKQLTSAKTEEKVKK